MIICTSLSQLDNSLSSLSKDYKIGFVPTMGALHKGHISLVKSALIHTKYVVVSIFVNPTQFNNPHDLNRYPRTVEADCKMLEEAGAYLVFLPSVEDIYPKLNSSISHSDIFPSSPDSINFDFGGLDKTGEGPRRPGHFNGVVQVVTRLFDIVKPYYAFFGEKDFQQLAIIRYITNKLKYSVKIIACPTLREADGLAMSSRNMLLSPERRKVAPRIYQLLMSAREEITRKMDVVTPLLLTHWLTEEINSEPLLKVEYVEIVNSLTLQIITNWNEAENIQLCTAVFAGEVRLIDNIKLK